MYISRISLVFILSYLALGGSIGCEVGTISTGKGEESPLPDDGRADSFYSPTEHGEILYGVPSEAEFTENSLYHVWDFVLQGQAELVIRVVPRADNFDTVMYLYRWEEGATSWKARSHAAAWVRSCGCGTRASVGTSP